MKITTRTTHDCMGNDIFFLCVEIAGRYFKNIFHSSNILNERIKAIEYQHYHLSHYYDDNDRLMLSTIQSMTEEN